MDMESVSALFSTEICTWFKNSTDISPDKVWSGSMLQGQSFHKEESAIFEQDH